MTGRRPLGGRFTGHEEWTVLAACRGALDPDVFHPESRDQHRDAAAAIQEWCWQCPVIRECLAGRHPQDRGCVRGGCYIDDAGKLWPYRELRWVKRRASTVVAYAGYYG